MVVAIAPSVGGEIVGHERIAGRRSARFADAHADPSQQQIEVPARKPAERGHGRQMTMQALSNLTRLTRSVSQESGMPIVT